MRHYFVYILASTTRRLYIGVTNDMARRLYEHRAGLVNFTNRYRMHRLVYVEGTTEPMPAIQREKQLKGLTRQKKIALIERDNPLWIDLGADPSFRPSGDPSRCSG